MQFNVFWGIFLPFYCRFENEKYVTPRNGKKHRNGLNKEVSGISPLLSLPKTGLKIRRPYGHRGSIPLPSTNAITKYQSGIYGPKKDERLFFTVFRSKASQSKPKAAFPFMNPEKLDIRPSKKTTLIRMRLALPV